MAAIHERPTLTDLVPAISASEAELLVDILRTRTQLGECPCSVVCGSWARVKAVVDARDRGMVVVVEGDIRLTPLGREWAQAFTVPQ